MLPDKFPLDSLKILAENIMSTNPDKAAIAEAAWVLAGYALNKLVVGGSVSDNGGGIFIRGSADHSEVNRLFDQIEDVISDKKSSVVGAASPKGAITEIIAILQIVIPLLRMLLNK
jgi:hypothetical protein